MKNAAYFQQTSFVESKFKQKAIRPKQENLFYIKTRNANFNLLNNKEKNRLVENINKLFNNDLSMLEYFAKKFNISIKIEVQGVELIIS